MKRRQVSSVKWKIQGPYLRIGQFRYIRGAPVKSLRGLSVMFSKAWRQYRTVQDVQVNFFD